MSNVHDHLWIDIFQQCDEKRIWKYRHHACEYGSIRAVCAMIASGTDVNQQEDEYGHTPLLIASWCGRVEATRVLLEAGADVNARSNLGGTPLWFANACGRVEVVKMLLAAA